MYHENIIALAINPNQYGGQGYSGLRFRDLTKDSNPCSINPGKGVLAVDSNGDVIYVPDSNILFATLIEEVDLLKTEIKNLKSSVYELQALLSIK